MRAAALRVGLIAAFLAAVVYPARAGAQDASSAADSTVISSGEVAAVVDAFHAALEHGDSTAVLALLDPDVTIYESGYAETFEEYRSGHLASDIEFAQTVESRVIDGWQELDAQRAIAGRVYAAEGTFRGRDIDAITTETMVLVRTTEDAWRVRHIHWSSRRATPPESP